MTVPRCKDCEHHHRSYPANYPRSPHHCKNPQLPDAYLSSRYIPSGRLSTSPVWCPKRKGAQVIKRRAWGAKPTRGVNNEKINF